MRLQKALAVFVIMLLSSHSNPGAGIIIHSREEPSLQGEPIYPWIPSVSGVTEKK